eukprot:230347_1
MSLCWKLTVILLAILHVQSQPFEFKVRISYKKGDLVPMVITISPSSSRPKLVKICLGDITQMANINYMNGYKKTNPTIIEISLIKPKQQTISVEFDTEKQATKFMGSYATCKVHSKSAKKKQFPKFIAGQSALPIIEDVHEKPNTNTNKKSHVQTQTKLTSKKK